MRVQITLSQKETAQKLEKNEVGVLGGGEEALLKSVKTLELW